MQFADAFKVPSSNHLIFTSFVLYFTSLIFLYGFIQVILFPSFLQNSSLLLIDWEYFTWYLLLFAKLLLIHSGFVLITTSGGIFSFSFFALILFFIFFWRFFSKFRSSLHLFWGFFSNFRLFFSYLAFLLLFFWHRIIFFLNSTHVIYNFPAFIINRHYRKPALLYKS